MLKINKTKSKEMILKLTDNFSLSSDYIFILENIFGNKYIIKSKVIYDLIKSKGYQNDLKVIIKNSVIYELKKDSEFSGFIRSYDKVLLLFENGKDYIYANLNYYYDDKNNDDYDQIKTFKIENEKIETLNDEIMFITDGNNNYIIDISSYREIKRYNPKSINLISVKSIDSFIDNIKFINYSQSVSFNY